LGPAGVSARLWVGAATMVWIDAPIGIGLVHHVTLDGVLAFLVLEGRLFLIHAARGLADAGIALEVEVVGGLLLVVLVGHVWSPWPSGGPTASAAKGSRRADHRSETGARAEPGAAYRETVSGPAGSWAPGAGPRRAAGHRRRDRARSRRGRWAAPGRARFRRAGWEWSRTGASAWQGSFVSQTAGARRGSRQRHRIGREPITMGQLPARKGVGPQPATEHENGSAEQYRAARHRENHPGRPHP